MERIIWGAERPAICRPGTYSWSDLVHRLFRRGDHYRIYLFLRVRELWHAYGDDSYGRATLALVIVMIVALDWPFRGQISVTPDPFIMTQQSWIDAPIGKN
jgi:hypothetical protein